MRLKNLRKYLLMKRLGQRRRAIVDAAAADIIILLPTHISHVRDEFSDPRHRKTKPSNAA
ncbi:MAG: hypothetical protein AMXMBFR84_25590 [Candidatus Hydrogenedentota bacterium]